MGDRDTPRGRKIGTARSCDECGQRLIRLVIEPVHRPADVDALRSDAGYWPVELLVHPTPEAARRFDRLAREHDPAAAGLWEVEGVRGALFLPKVDPRAEAVVKGWDLKWSRIQSDALRLCSPLSSPTAAELWEILDALQP